MKALILKSNGQVFYDDVVDPNVKDDECLISVKASGVCNSDIGRAFSGGAYFYPLIMGHEFAGEVVKTGKKVTGFEIGDKVGVFPLIPCNQCEFCLSKNYAQCLDYNYYGSRCNGSFADLVSVKEWNLIKLPDDIGYEEASLLEPVAVAIHAIKKAKILKDYEVVILGAGLIGMTIAHYLKMKLDVKKVIVMDRNEEKLNLLRNYGIETICLKDKNCEKNNLKADVVFEACGSPNTFLKSIEIVKSHGQVIWVGNITSDLDIPKKLVSLILRKEINIIGSWNSSFTKDAPDDWHEAIKYIGKNDFIKKIITHKLPLSEGVKFLNYLFDRRTNREKYINDNYIKGIFIVK